MEKATTLFIAPPLSSLCAARKAGAGGLSTAFLKIVRREEKVGSPHPIAPILASSVRCSVFPDNFLGRMGSRRGDQLRAAPISGSFDSGHAAFTVRTSLLWARASALERMADATRHTTSLGKVEGVVALDVNLVGWWNLARKRRLWSRSIRAVFLCARRSARPQPHRQTTSRRQRHSVRAP